MPEQRTIDGIPITIIRPDIGEGGQGRLHLGQHAQSGADIAVKALPASGEMRDHTAAVIDMELWRASPLLAAPFAAQEAGQEHHHIALFMRGSDLLNAAASGPYEHFRVAFLLSCLWHALESRGIAHADIAPGNVIVSHVGVPNLIDFDNAAIPHLGIESPMRGQNMMLAPELRKGGAPDLLSDRFAWAVLLNIWLLRRHPAESLARTPAELARLMSSGTWPERTRSSRPDVLSIDTLGTPLCDLFDKAFDLDPKQRPSATEWRRLLLDRMEPYIGHVGTPSRRLEITLPNRRQRFSLPLFANVPLILGRRELGGSPSISRRQLSVLFDGNTISFKHLGSNPTALKSATGVWAAMHSQHFSFPLKKPLTVNIAGTLVRFQLR